MHTPSMPLLKKIADITGYGIDFLIGSTNNVSVPTNKTFEISGISFPISEFEFDYTFRSRFEKLCIQHNITSENSLEMLSIPRTDFTEIKYNRFPTLPELLRIAYAFDVSMDYLIGKTDTPFSGLSKDELHLILNYRDCIEPYKQNIQERAEKLCNESLTHTPIATDEQLKKTGTDHTGK